MQPHVENKPLLGMMMWAGAILSAVAIGCGQSASDSPKPSIQPTDSGRKQSQGEKASTTETPEASALGHLSGMIIYEGPMPDLPLLVRQGADIKDAEVCAAHDIPDESLVVDEGTKGLANVFVYLGRAPQGAEAPVPDEPVLFDQKDCRFVPHALTVRVGQPVQVTSADPISHNVHTLPLRNSSLNTTSPPNDREGMELIYRRAEPAPVRVKCDIHSWMSAYHLPLDHPFMAVTDAEGRFEIRDLPAGKHEFRIWHERAEFLERDHEVEIQADETTEVSLSYPAEKFGVGGSR